MDEAPWTMRVPVKGATLLGRVVFNWKAFGTCFGFGWLMESCKKIDHKHDLLIIVSWYWLSIITENYSFWSIGVTSGIIGNRLASYSKRD